MSLQANVSLKFIDYTPLDSGVQLNFTCADPGGGEPGDYTIVLTDAEIAGITTKPIGVALIRNKLQRKYRSSGFTAALDGLKDQSLVI